MSSNRGNAVTAHGPEGCVVNDCCEGWRGRRGVSHTQMQSVHCPLSPRQAQKSLSKGPKHVIHPDRN